MKMTDSTVKIKNLSRYPTKKQSGSVLIVVLFVVLVMGLLATTLARLEWTNQDTQTREIFGTRAWFMAHSANEWALTQLFPLGESGESSEVLSRCDAVNNDWEAQTTMINDNSCTITSVTCSYQNIPDEYAEYRYYTLVSVASCGEDGLYQVERAQQVVVKGIEE